MSSCPCGAVSVSQGLMLETSAERLCARGGPHFGSPDKRPAVRLEVIRAAGEAAIPFTSGILIGIGETRHERLVGFARIAFVARAIWTSSGSHHSEFSRQARHQNGGPRRARSRRSFMDDRGGTAGLRRRDEHSGAAQLVARRASTACRRRVSTIGAACRRLRLTTSIRSGRGRRWKR